MMGCAYKEYRDKQVPHYKPYFQFGIRNHSAAAWMEYLRPLMGQRRQGQIDTVLQKFAAHNARAYGTKALGYTKDLNAECSSGATYGDAK